VNDATLGLGSRGAAVRELQLRLLEYGIDSPSDGEFDDATADAVTKFQESRGLRATGVCERETWQALVEAGFELGDRLLYAREPMLRGDDVFDLQRRLNALGFHTGREDGIFGPLTEHGVSDFQRNAGLAVDGVCGPSTCARLLSVGALADGSVASVRERERWRSAPRALGHSRVFVVVEPGLDVLGESIARGLADAGARVVVDRTGTDDSALARSANDFAADTVLALRAADAPGPRCSYFATPTFRSEGGHAIAHHLSAALDETLGPAPAPEGRAFALLRETRAAAVVCELVRRGDVAEMRALVERSALVAGAFVRGVRCGIEEPRAAVGDG
jgi:N-acetylmuramoyl-L-alanine amidase